MITIIIADDHSLVMQGMRFLLQNAKDMILVDECSNGRDALELIRRHKPTIALLDILISGIDAISLTSLLAAKQPQTAVIILGTHDDPMLIEKSANAGARGYLLKNTDFAILIDTIRQVATGVNLLLPCPENLLDHNLKNTPE